MQVRELRRHEWTLFRSLRLRALAESPDAFAQTLADAQSRPDSYWTRLAESVTGLSGQVMLIAEEADRPVGLVFGLLDSTEPATGRVGGMWVDPGARGRGVGAALLDAVVAWARARGLQRLELWVTEGNAAAARLYRVAGFGDTGRRDRLSSNPELHIIQMALIL